MTANQPIAPLRRRPIPGMTGTLPPTAATTTTDAPTTSDATNPDRAEAPEGASAGQAMDAGARRRSSADYSATRLANFRLPVDLHDHYRRLVRKVEDSHPRLRRPSLTEVIIGLLEEGPADVDELAAVIRRKRASETAEDQS
jgi:hypothetical protein